MSVNVSVINPVSASAARFLMMKSPDLTRIPSHPLVSCLCVTENRQAFIPWLLWNFDRQTWKKRELVIVDSSDPPIRELTRRDVRIIRVSPGTWLGKKRNLALESARGQAIAWFDDDDWQHPDRLTFLVPLLRTYAARLGTSFIGPDRSGFLDLYSDRVQPYFTRRYAIFNGSIYYTESARKARFPENVLRTEDTMWISRLLRTCTGAVIEGNQPTLFMWLSHDANISNRRSWRHANESRYTQSDFLGAYLRETRAQLAALRERIDRCPAQPPTRAMLFEGARLEQKREG